MRQILPLLVVVLAWCLAGCENRDPLGRAQVVALADHLQRRDGFDWGQPIEVISAGEADARGRSWWQVRYPDGGDGVARVILVDADSGWARLPPAGYRLRTTPAGSPSSERPVETSRGSFVLLVTPPEAASADRETALDRETVRLNELARNTGLGSLFSLRHGRDGRIGIIFGWHDEHGIARDERVVEWLTVRTPHRGFVWEDLATRP
jgi:hypothetical protein